MYFCPWEMLGLSLAVVPRCPSTSFSPQTTGLHLLLPTMALPATCCSSFPKSRIHPPKNWPKNWTPSSRNWSRQNPKVSNNCQLNFSLNFLNFSFTIQRFSPSFQYSSSVFSLATTATSFFVAAAVSTFFLAVVLLSLFYLSISFSPISLTCHDSELILYFFVHFD